MVLLDLLESGVVDVPRLDAHLVSVVLSEYVDRHVLNSQQQPLIFFASSDRGSVSEFFDLEFLHFVQQLSSYFVEMARRVSSAHDRVVAGVLPPQFPQIEDGYVFGLVKGEKANQLTDGWQFPLFEDIYSVSQTPLL